ncbi:hypothetical protein ACFQVD_42045 [Streptosporangium amethystogenes subsp. fukuiense]|uniref:Uncharacterized protein n=1 Tax=Streptosporangium amethystogenes subsp. fukuiense TaxID=698418 RepID=A0ABW2TG01_9ACTN
MDGRPEARAGRRARPKYATSAATSPRPVWAAKTAHTGSPGIAMTAVPSPKATARTLNAARGGSRSAADVLAVSRFAVSALAETTAGLLTLATGMAAHPGERTWLDAHLPA